MPTERKTETEVTQLASVSVETIEPSSTPPDAEEKPRRRKKNRDKVPWRQRVSLATLLLWTVLFSIVGAGFASGYYGYQVLYENKLTDTWAIMFLELERQGNQLASRLEDVGRQSAPAAPDGREMASQPRLPEVVLRVEPDGRLVRMRGDAPDTLTLTDLNLKAAELKDPMSVLMIGGESFLTSRAAETETARILGESVPRGTYLLMWKVDIASWFLSGARNLDGVTAYLLSKQGRLLFSNAPQVTQVSYVQRPLVQKFIGAPIRQGQFDFVGEEGPSYGFFYEVPSTNIMMFVETPRKVALASVNEVAFRYALVMLVILSIAALILQFPLNSMLSPMRELVRLAWEVGEGNFDIKPQAEGFGELNLLTRSFYDMGQNLIARDEKINMLLVEQQEKIRLADEVAIARSIQDNFLSKAAIPRESGLEVVTHYTPAAECAGDWYGYFYDESTDESVFVVADVSGHGAGSAMFTAIIAATFEEMRAERHPKFPLEEFARRLNRLILKLGQGKWHATLLAVRFQKSSKEIEVLNAGHPFPLLVPPAEAGIKPEPVDLRSDLIGISLDFAPGTKTIPFMKGMSLLMFTDGLIEGRPDRKQYSHRRLNKACHLQSHQSLSLLVEGVYKDWLEYLEGQPALDDLCLMAVRAL